MNDDLYQHLPVLPDRITNVPAGEEVNIGLIDAPPANPLRDSRFNRTKAGNRNIYEIVYLRLLPLIAESSITVPMITRPRMMDCQFALIPIMLIPL